jgi:hypothetical protein
MLESLESGLWSCIVEHALELLDLLCAIFVFCLIWLRLQIGTWGGVVRQDVKYPPPHLGQCNLMENRVVLSQGLTF